MMRALGAVLVAAGGAWLGLRAAEELRRRERALDDMVSGLALLEQELGLGGLPLAPMFHALSEQVRGPAKNLFAACGSELLRTDRPAFPVTWSRLVEELPGLDKEARRTLSLLGETLGRCDSGSQQQAVKVVRTQLEELRCRAGEERRRQGRVYQILGLTGGAFLVILLM